MLSHFSHVQLCATPGTTAHGTPLSMGLSRQEYWSAMPFLGDVPNTGTKPASLVSPLWQTGSLSLVPPGKPDAYLRFSK